MLYRLALSEVIYLSSLCILSLESQFGSSLFLQTAFHPHPKTTDALSGCSLYQTPVDFKIKILKYYFHIALQLNKIAVL